MLPIFTTYLIEHAPPTPPRSYPLCQYKFIPASLTEPAVPSLTSQPASRLPILDFVPLHSMPFPDTVLCLFLESHAAPNPLNESTPSGSHTAIINACPFTHVRTADRPPPSQHHSLPLRRGVKPAIYVQDTASSPWPGLAYRSLGGGGSIRGVGAQYTAYVGRTPRKFKQCDDR